MRPCRARPDVRSYAGRDLAVEGISGQNYKLSPHSSKRTQGATDNHRSYRMSRDIKQAVRSYVEQNFLVGSDTRIGDADSLLQMQIVDSTGFLELVNFIESSFGVKVGDDEMVPENLETIDNIDEFVRRKLAT
jgi:acyl carrier protein